MPFPCTHGMFLPVCSAPLFGSNFLTSSACMPSAPVLLRLHMIMRAARSWRGAPLKQYSACLPCAGVHHDREQEASSSGREDAGGESEGLGQGAASGSGPAPSTAAQGGGRGGRGGRPRVGQPIGKRDVTGRLRHGRPQGMKERCTEPFFQLGDTVAARIIWANERGARAELLQETRLVGCASTSGVSLLVVCAWLL